MEDSGTAEREEKDGWTGGCLAPGEGEEKDGWTGCEKEK